MKGTPIDDIKSYFSYICGPVTECSAVSATVAAVQFQSRDGVQKAVAIKEPKINGTPVTVQSALALKTSRPK